MASQHPFHPIIYVRGFAMTSGEIEDAVSDPYMGFNVGSTKSRCRWDRSVNRFYFESPVVRLSSDYGYEDVIHDGKDMVTTDQPTVPVPYRCIVVHRYYEDASKAFSDGEGRPIEHFAKGLSDLILRLKERVCSNPENNVQPHEFRVYLIAHSMGGLVCRAMLQNPQLGAADARAAVDKLFTYATPHNGIDLRIVRNVPGWASFGDANNFNRKRMSGYFGYDGEREDVSDLGPFPAERVFNLVGTNPQDYLVLKGLSSWAAGSASDGLVRIENATTYGTDANGKRVTSPRAFVNRSHSGHYGIVNSEEGYQNLSRFLFGQIRVDGFLDIDDITLPAAVEAKRLEGKKIRASYEFEVSVAIRGCQWQMHRRNREEHSAIFRTFDELFPGEPGTNRPPDRSNSPHLFSVFLDQSQKAKSTLKSLNFAFDLAALVPDYEIDEKMWFDQHYEGGAIFRDSILIAAIPDSEAPAGWRVNYGYMSLTPGVARRSADLVKDAEGKLSFTIPVEQKRRPGLKGAIRIEATPWNA